MGLDSHTLDLNGLSPVKRGSDKNLSQLLNDIFCIAPIRLRPFAPASTVSSWITAYVRTRLYSTFHHLFVNVPNVDLHLFSAGKLRANVRCRRGSVLNDAGEIYSREKLQQERERERERERRHPIYRQKSTSSRSLSSDKTGARRLLENFLRSLKPNESHERSDY